MFTVSMPPIAAKIFMEKMQMHLGLSGGVKGSQEDGTSSHLTAGPVSA